MFICVYFVCFCFMLHSCCIIVSMVGWTWWDWSLILRCFGACCSKLKQFQEAQTIVTNTIICTQCGGAGHIAADCKQKRSVHSNVGPFDTLSWVHSSVGPVDTLSWVHSSVGQVDTLSWSLCCRVGVLLFSFKNFHIFDIFDIYYFYDVI